MSDDSRRGRAARSGAVVHITSPAPRAVWLEVLESDPTAFVYQTPAGLDAICAGLGCEDASRLYEFPNGRKLILLLYRRRGLPWWLTVEKSPQIGSLVSPGPVRSEELQAIFADLQRRRLLRTAIRPTALSGDSWAAHAPAEVQRVQRRAHVLDLEGGFQAVWQDRFNSQARRAVRKAEKAGLDVECDTTGRLVPVFYDLLERSVDRWATQTREPRFLARWRLRYRDPMRRFEITARKLEGACRIWIARVGGKPAAGIIVLQGRNAHYTRGAMDKDLAGPVRASFLLQKLAIEDACRTGCRYYNMGETGASETLARFKSHFGAQAFEYAEYRLERIPLTRYEAGLRRMIKRMISRASSSA